LHTLRLTKSYLIPRCQQVTPNAQYFCQDTWHYFTCLFLLYMSYSWATARDRAGSLYTVTFASWLCRTRLNSLC